MQLSKYNNLSVSITEDRQAETPHQKKNFLNK